MFTFKIKHVISAFLLKVKELFLHVRVVCVLICRRPTKRHTYPSESSVSLNKAFEGMISLYVESRHGQDSSHLQKALKFLSMKAVLVDIAVI